MKEFSKFDKVLIVLSLVVLAMLTMAQEYLGTQQRNDFELDKAKVFMQENCRPSPAGKIGGETNK